ncbi:hypothetical protein ACJ72_05901 [Emergomyces africanus]|uniref:Fumarylacetoacetase n=1 Tax=Emergomyces africanus TaxID=1955775 RepID=A0A1B7NSQ0_9EURO|nr:hypothetical protein ACJ72_05901 [Emergomyces africanus]
MTSSWLQIPKESPFSLANIPFGIISTSASSNPRPAIAIGDHALDLFAFASGGGFAQLPSFQQHLEVFAKPTLNEFAALGRPVHRQVREYLQAIFKLDTPFPELLKSNEPLKQSALVLRKDVTNHLPLSIGCCCYKWPPRDPPPIPEMVPRAYSRPSNK